jgi:hypothetical protein
MADNKEKPTYLKMDGHCRTSVHFGKKVKVFTPPVEYWCVVYHPDDESLTACWRMPKGLTVYQAGARSVFQTHDSGYERDYTVALPSKIL